MQRKTPRPFGRGVAVSAFAGLSIKRYSEMADNSRPILRSACPILCACASDI